MLYPILLPKMYNLDLTMRKHQKRTGFVSKKKINAGCLRTVNPACILQGQCKQIGSESFSVEGVFQWAHQSYQNLQCELFMGSLEILGIQLWSISGRLFLLRPLVCFSLIYIFTIKSIRIFHQTLRKNFITASPYSTCKIKTLKQALILQPQHLKQWL